MNLQQLQDTANAMVAPGKGILAMDESNGTCNKRFTKLGIETTEAKRREYRDMLLTTKGLPDFIGGAILFDETIHQSTLKGIPFPKYMQDVGIIPGIKVDTGAKELALRPGETVTEGLDGLRERLAAYYKIGARFAKWRAVITIGKGIPTDACIEANAHALARYAALCQEANIVPIVEPEVLMDGDHTIERSYKETEKTQLVVFDQLKRQGVALEGIILKPSMVISGADCPTQASIKQVAEETIRCLLKTVPREVPGIAFLSGGQSDEDATAHLNAMHNLGKKLPWALSFSYGRALQHASMTAWAGKPENVPVAQKILHHRGKLNGAAALGKYSEKMEKEAA